MVRRDWKWGETNSSKLPSNSLAQTQLKLLNTENMSAENMSMATSTIVLMILLYVQPKFIKNSTGSISLVRIGLWVCATFTIIRYEKELKDMYRMIMYA